MTRPIPLNESVFLVGSGELGLTHYLDCHVYLIASQDEYALVDAGAGVETTDLIANIRSAIGNRGALRYLLLTHCHGDHAGGVHSIQLEFPDMQVASSDEESRLLELGTEAELGLTQAKYAGTYPAGFVFHHAAASLVLKDGQDLRLGSLRIRALHTPGHTKGGVTFAVQSPSGLMLFSGDTVFWGGLIQLLNTPGSDIADYRNSAATLTAIDADAMFPGHGLWVLRHARAHLQKLGEYFRRSGVPPMPARIDKIVPDLSVRGGA